MLTRWIVSYLVDSIILLSSNPGMGFCKLTESSLLLESIN